MRSARRSCLLLTRPSNARIIAGALGKIRRDQCAFADMSTYKSSAGLRRLIVSNDAEIAKRLDAIAFLGWTRFRCGQTAALALKRSIGGDFGAGYAQAIIDVAQAWRRRCTIWVCRFLPAGKGFTRFAPRSR